MLTSANYIVLTSGYSSGEMTWPLLAGVACLALLLALLARALLTLSTQKSAKDDGLKLFSSLPGPRSYPLVGNGAGEG